MVTWSQISRLFKTRSFPSVYSNDNRLYQFHGSKAEIVIFGLRPESLTLRNDEMTDCEISCAGLTQAEAYIINSDMHEFIKAESKNNFFNIIFR